MALIHKAQGSFNVDLDFEKKERLLKQAMFLDNYNKSSKRLARFGSIVDWMGPNKIANPFNESSKSLVQNIEKIRKELENEARDLEELSDDNTEMADCRLKQ